MKPNDRFRAFRRELAAEGFLRRTSGRIICQLALFVSLTFLGIGLLLVSDHWVIDFFAMLLITLAGMGVSTNAHTASHNAISERRWVNKLIFYFGFTFFLQVSASFWHYKHLRIHHGDPNVIGIDDDAVLAPYFALTAKEVAEARPWHRCLYRIQWLYFPVLLVGNAFNVILSGWIFLLGKLANPEERRTSHWIDLGVLVLHQLVWIYLPLLFIPPQDVFLFTTLRFTLMSYGMFALFAPAHFPAEALMLADSGADDDFVAAQAVATINYQTGWIGRLICGGVEFQIEHHLFPTISPTHYPALSQRVREFFDKNGYPYRSIGWGTALWKSWVVLRDPKPVYASLDAAAEQIRAMNNDVNVTDGLTSRVG